MGIFTDIWIAHKMEQCKRSARDADALVPNPTKPSKPAPYWDSVTQEWRLPSGAWTDGGNPFAMPISFADCMAFLLKAALFIGFIGGVLYLAARLDARLTPEHRTPLLFVP